MRIDGVRHASHVRTRVTSARIAANRNHCFSRGPIKTSLLLPTPLTVNTLCTAMSVSAMVFSMVTCASYPFLTVPQGLQKARLKVLPTGWISRASSPQPPGVLGSETFDHTSELDESSNANMSTSASPNHPDVQSVESLSGKLNVVFST